MVKQCPKCGVYIKHSTHYYPHIKHCGDAQQRVTCLQCEKTFSRKDVMLRHFKKAHPEPTKRFSCKECKKPFAYEMTLHLHEETCGKPKPKPFQCSFAGCGKCFCRKSTLEHHQQHVHLSQLGGGVKRKQEEDSKKETKENQTSRKSRGCFEG